MQNQIVVHNQSVQDITAMAQAAVKSGLFGVKNQDQAVALMLLAQSENAHPFSVCTQFDIIQGRPALKSSAALARFQAAGGKIQWIERTDTKASAKFNHPSGGELIVEWTIEMAKAAGLTGKQTWAQYPRQLLSARVLAEGVRAILPGCLNGIYLAEEVQDFDSKPRPAKEVIELVHEAPSAKKVPSLPEPPKEIYVEIDEAPAETQISWWNTDVEKQIIQAGEDIVNNYLVNKGKIEPSYTWKDIKDETYRSNLVAKTSKFIEAVNKAK